MAITAAPMSYSAEHKKHPRKSGTAVHHKNTKRYVMEVKKYLAK